jgi:hypothetical protein
VSSRWRSEAGKGGGRTALLCGVGWRPGVEGNGELAPREAACGQALQTGTTVGTCAVR